MRERKLQGTLLFCLFVFLLLRSFFLFVEVVAALLSHCFVAVITVLLLFLLLLRLLKLLLQLVVVLVEAGTEIAKVANVDVAV